MNLKFVVTVFIFSLSTSGFAKSGTVLAWKTASGSWRACGPVQCTSSSYKTEGEAVSLVISEVRHKVQYQGAYGRCSQYDVSGMDFSDVTSQKVFDRAKCH